MGHGLLQPTLQKWADSLSSPKKDARAVEPASSDAPVSWQSILHDVTLGAAPAPPQNEQDTSGASAPVLASEVCVDHGHGDDNALDQEDQEADAAMYLDRAAFNESMRKKACAWARLPGLPSAIATFRHCIAPIMGAIHRHLFVGSDAWDKEQEILAIQGQARSFKVLDEAAGNGVTEFHANLFRRFHSVLPAVQQVHMTRSIRVLSFKLLSRCGSAMHFIVDMTRKSFPTKLYSGIVQNDARALYAAAQATPCLLDEFSKEFFGMFPTVDGYFSSDAQAILLTIAGLWETDITLIEARHAAVRRLVKSRSVQTHAPRLDHINGDYACRQHARQFLRVYSGTLEKNQARKTKKVRAASKSKLKKYKPHNKPGGPWKAFLHLRMKGGKFSRQDMGKLAEEYHSLQKEELEWFKELGELAKVKAQAGFGGMSAIEAGVGPDPVFVPPTVALDVERPQLDLQQTLQESWKTLKQLEQQKKTTFEAAQKLWQEALRPEKTQNAILNSLQQSMSLERKPYAAVGGGRGSGVSSGLKTSLDKRLEARSDMYYHSEQPSSTDKNKSQNACKALEFCVCSEPGRSALFMHTKFSALWKPHLQARRARRKKIARKRNFQSRRNRLLGNCLKMLAWSFVSALTDWTLLCRLLLWRQEMSHGRGWSTGSMWGT
eukprot:Skav219731  [mRNA]  locus=scaffold301:344635:349193:- [translate_table: standard]